MTHASLCTGIAGFDLAAEWTGWENIFQCEINPFCQAILKYHFPQCELHNDIKTTDFTKYYGAIDILSAGFPCQPFSVAGKRKGADDDRHLWPEVLRAIWEISPRWFMGENVGGLLTQQHGVVFERVCTDLEAAGYEVQSFVIPACAVGAPHRRDRVWIIAHARCNERQEDTKRERSADEENNEQPKRTHSSNAAKNTIGDGCTEREFKENGAAMGKQWNVSTGSATGFIYNRGVAANADGKLSRSRNPNCVGKIKQADALKSFGSAGNCKSKILSTNTQSERLQERNAEQAQYRTHATTKRRDCLPSWRNFPTQPPICSGNDGLSNRLDGITFPSWRRQSIEAYGNAIVPQVAYQIFKAINEIQKLTP